ncbi:hypothetical protein H634G_02060 [Metarhizium anisopliae BRIP 53293]|uniref:Uncharacterized protein n=1 Tax=Metarhizium anisopliae BRIP 53293 TaxID=1291518 RepID=A0A0D9P9T4_METAN|nr:hypothetical protein H634G_02060 [Metarhizium anisopliae BRIP 53293]KJK95171.1 hypothetical protein H633G_00974 [Metarhizium anisopliae BRIP 53284]
MKYSVLSAISFLAVSSLGFPEFYWGVSTASPGQIIVTNNMNRPVRLDKVAQGPSVDGAKIIRDQEIILNQGQTVAVSATEISADLKFNEEQAHNQVELSYSSGDQGTYNFAIKPIEGGGFPGAIEVIPLSPRPSPRCHPLVWYPGQGNTPQATCQDRTPLRVFLREAHHPPEFNKFDKFDGWY